MATTTNLGVAKLETGQANKETTINEAFDAFDAAIAAPYASAPVPVTGATTLTASAFDKAHVATGTTVDYTITLPTLTSDDIGKVIAFRMDNALTKLVTLDAGATRSIDGLQTRVMWKDETALLLCVGTSGACWVKISGKTRPMIGAMHLGANQSIANATGPVKLTLNILDVDNGGMCDTVNNRFNVKRTGNYELTAQAWFNSVAVTTGLLDFYKNGAQIFETYDMSPSASYNLVPKGTLISPLTAGDNTDLRVYQNSGGAQNAIGHATTKYTYMSIVEIPEW